jgi:hypothetical protein
MPATRSPQSSRPDSAPPYYLGRPASGWITVVRHRPQARAGTLPPQAPPA